MNSGDRILLEAIIVAGLVLMEWALGLRESAWFYFGQSLAVVGIANLLTRGGES